MGKLKFPYTMHCSRCKAPLRIKNEGLIGKTIKCPKCEKSIQVVTPDEDGAIPYEVEAMPEPEPDPGPTEEEILARELKEKKERREKNWALFKYLSGFMFYVLLVVISVGLCYKFIYIEGYLKEMEAQNNTGPKYVAPK